MQDVPPVEKLCYAILLSSLKKRATDIVIRRDTLSRVEFTIDGAISEEMRPPRVLHPVLVRKIGVMAGVPYYKKGEHGLGRLMLKIGSELRAAIWDVRLDGHGDDVSARLRLVEYVGAN
ncbi:MAG: hypothetical protein QM831_02685 [Kofleriaceae bacterium]